MAKKTKLRKDDFDLTASTPGEESAVGTYQVDDDEVLFCDLARPLVLALTTVQTVTVSADATETKALAPAAPRVPHMDDPTNGEFSPHAFLVGYYDADGDGSKDTVVTDQTAVSIDGFTTDGNFVREITLTDTTGSDTDVDIYTVVRGGYGRIRRRHRGGGMVTDQLTKKDAFEWAFADPHDRDRQVRWGDENGGLEGAIGPDQYVDVLFYDNAEQVVVPGNHNPTNLIINLPFQRRGLKDEETYEGVRNRIKQTMV